jgi:hypothetical protein
MPRAPLLLAPLLVLACSVAPDPSPPPASAAPSAASAPAPAPPAPPAPHAEASACRARIDAVLARPPLPGAPAFEAARVEILGRARGEPMVFVREPAATPKDALPPRLTASAELFAREKPGGRRMASLRGRHKGDPASLRALVLREGYAYASDPHDALALVTTFTLADLFAEPTIWLARGSTIRALTRVEGREVRYVDEAGRAEGLLLGDRVATSEAELVRPLHRDLAALADSVGFDRTRIRHMTEEAIVAELRFGEAWTEALLEAEGPKLRLGCMAAEGALRESIESFRAETAGQSRALFAMRAAVTAEIDEGLRFDRPEEEPDHMRDGALRPVWLGAYLQGRPSFQFEGKSYSVFDSRGRAHPPEVCVDFVLDTYERAAGTWYRPRGEPAGRTRGRLDFSELDIPNRRGVIGFGDFAEATPDLFEMRRFVGPERIPFGERSRFFAYLRDHADLRPGDVVAIQGMKRDDNIHQHAILVERTDPVTGFPFGLADQMKRPRRRTWEGIMAEAPKRSLFYRARPTDALIGRLDPGAAPAP